MNAHSVGARVSSGQSLLELGDELLCVRRAHAAVDDLEDFLARERGGDGVEVEVEVRRGDAELHQHGALGARGFEQGALGAVMDDGEVDVLVEGEVGDVLDVLPPHDHGVPADAPVVVHDDPDAVVLKDDLAGLARIGAEEARCHSERNEESPSVGIPRSARDDTAHYNRASMRTIRFRSTGSQVPAISLGTWGHGGPNTNEGVSVGWTGHDDNLAKEAMIEAYRHGITHWDTADAYGGGHAETLIGAVCAHDVPRSAIFVATKFGYVKGPANHYYDTAFMRAQLEASLANMRTDRVDLYYFHHCDFGPDDRYFDDALEQVRRFR